MIGHFWGCTPMEVENAPIHRIEEARVVLSARHAARVRFANKRKCALFEVVLPEL